ncbi:hypothetical protein HDR58_08395 [bacterium]|nr:hypothetical protein [bacterium]
MNKFPITLRDSMDISKVDFNDIDSVVGFGALIMSHTNISGLVNGISSRQSGEVIQLTETARRWVKEVKYILPGISAADAFKLTDIYDLIHRIAFRQPADTALLDNLILSAFDSRIHGDNSVDEYRLYHAIDLQIHRRNRAFMDKPLQWLCINLDRWHKNFKTGNWRKLTDYDIIRQSGILIDADLYAFEVDSTEFKRNLFENNRHWLDEIEGMTLLELEALSKFLIYSANQMSYEEYCKYDEAIMNAVIVHPDTDTFYRKSLEMNLELMYD